MSGQYEHPSHCLLVDFNLINPKVHCSLKSGYAIYGVGAVNFAKSVCGLINMYKK